MLPLTKQVELLAKQVALLTSKFDPATQAIQDVHQGQLIVAVLLAAILLVLILRK